jgi:hypothetical protein
VKPRGTIFTMGITTEDRDTWDVVERGGEGTNSEERHQLKAQT